MENSIFDEAGLTFRAALGARIYVLIVLTVAAPLCAATVLVELGSRPGNFLLFISGAMRDWNSLDDQRLIFSMVMYTAPPAVLLFLSFFMSRPVRWAYIGACIVLGIDVLQAGASCFDFYKGSDPDLQMKSMLLHIPFIIKFGSILAGYFVVRGLVRIRWSVRRPPRLRPGFEVVPNSAPDPTILDVPPPPAATRTRGRS